VILNRKPERHKYDLPELYSSFVYTQIHGTYSKSQNQVKITETGIGIRNGIPPHRTIMSACSSRPRQYDESDTFSIPSSSSRQQ
jgi:hypothetical protein